MKKKVTILAALLIAVIGTSYSVSGTYAKYVSEVNLGSDSARVAKWEVKLDEAKSKTFNLFSTTYENEDGKPIVVADKDVVAPGTSGSYTFALTGNVETNYTLALTVKGNNDVKIDDYDPLEFYLAEGSADMDAVESKTWYSFDELQTNINSLYTGDTVYAAGAVDETAYTIYWRWEFDGNKTNDEKDTALGEAIAKDETAHTVELTITVTATQSKKAATKQS